MDGDERNQARHRQKMHQTRALKSAEQRAQPSELHGLPDREPRDHEQDKVEHRKQISGALHLVVLPGIVVRETATQRSEAVEVGFETFSALKRRVSSRRVLRAMMAPP